MTRRLSIIAAVATVGMILVPVAGMVLAVLDPPPGLELPPARTVTELAPLIARTLALAFFVSVASLVLGTWLAWVERRVDAKGVRLLSVLSILPLAVPSYLLATIVRESMAPGGPLGQALGTSGRFTGFWPAALVLVITTTPFVQLLVGAALGRLPVDQEEAARSLGAGPWRRFKSLVVPHLRPTWAFSLVIVALYTISDFGAVAVLDCQVLTWELFKAYSNFDVVGAVQLGFGLMLLVLPLLVGVRLLHGTTRVERGVGGVRTVSRRSLPAWGSAATWLAWAFVVGLGVFLPVWTLGSWLVSGLEAPGVAFAPIGDDIIDTALLGFAGAWVALLMAFIPAWAVVRSMRRRRWFVEQGTYLTSSLPGVLVAFGIVQMAVVLKRNAPFEVGGESFWLLLERFGFLVVLGYTMRFLAEGYAALKPAVLRLDPRQEESARSLGAGAPRRMWRVVLPQLAPGLAAAYVLLFLSIVKELPITMMLLPAGRTTLAYRVFDAQREGLLPDVGLAGMVLLVLALCVQLVLLRWRRHV